MSTDAMIGQTVDGKYRIVERIGRGGMGTVYRAVDDTLNRDVAIKVLNTGLQEPEIAQRFRAEAMIVARLNHPGITMVYELFEHSGQWLMVMEFVPGETLEALIERAGPLSPERAAEVCLYALSALAHAHNLGIVHRDLKPANLMIAQNGVIKVMDFGIARVTGTDHLTSEGYMMGTPAYMAPEQVLGGDIDARADLYAMGVVFYRLVTGKLPFTGETPFAVAQSHVNDAPTPIGLLRADLPPWVDQMVSRALAKRPDERFQSAAAFHDVLSKCLADRSSTATYDPSAPTELMVTPPFAIPTGAIRPPVDTARTLVEPVPAAATTEAAPASNTRMLALGATLVVLLVIGGVIWSTSSPPTPVAETTPADVTSDAARGAGSRAAVPPPAPADGRKAGAAVTVPPASTEPIVFSDVKLLTVTGNKAKDQDVTLNLLADRIWVTAKSGGPPLQSLLYTRVMRATYVHAKAPKFDPIFPAAPADMDMPGLLSTTRHWLALQARDTYVILRLEDSNFAKILDEIQTRARVKIVKPG